MDIIEKSKEYAKGKALEAISSAIEQAYVDGYNAGLNHLENEKMEALKDGVEYKDLGLKKKTLWSSKYIKYDNSNGTKCMGYMEASKFNLPTKEQFEELCSVCYAEHHNANDYKGIKFTGITGETILIGYLDKNQIGFWLKDDEDSNEKLVANVIIEKCKAKPQYTKAFMGLKYPVMVVKKG